MSYLSTKDELENLRLKLDEVSQRNSAHLERYKEAKIRLKIAKKKILKKNIRIYRLKR